MSPRRGQLLDRSVANRDARLWLIATEDTYAGRHYFEAIEANRVIDARKVRLLVLETPSDDTRSAPRYVLERLNAARTEVGLSPMDRCWISIDLDNWRADMLAEVCREARQQGHGVAVSNPCFEAWLLLHLSDGPLPVTGAEAQQALRALLPGYSKRSLPSEPFTRPAVDRAISAARALDAAPEERWPVTPGSRVYRLLEEILGVPSAPPITPTPLTPPPQTP